MSNDDILNVEEGVARLVNNRAFYAKLLVRFSASLPQVPAQIKEHLSKGELEEAERLAHSIKGSGANLSANALADIMGEVEKAISNNEPVDTLLEKSQEIIDLTLKSISEFKA